MNTIDKALKEGKGGLYYGNRVLLPFIVDILKLGIENDIISDFRATKHGAQYIQQDSFTEVYFEDYSSLQDTVTKYESVKMIVVEKGKDIFDLKNHVKLILHFKEHHMLELEIPDDDVLFIE
ncbi:MAG: hypothetical protein KKA84_10605 [Bacteroidetes bacterium]|nr:hypothetical protein [Bacteroidota bacterium]